MSSVDENIELFVTTAEKFHGVKEGTPQHSIILALYNSSRPDDEYEMTANDPWCAAFVGAVSGGCGLQNIVPVSAHCGRLETALLKKKAVQVTESTRGDIALFDWNGNGKYDDHVGIVVKAEPAMITTIEGNRNDMVAYRQFSPNSLSVKFYRPNWKGKTVQATEPIKWEKYRDFYHELPSGQQAQIRQLPLLYGGSAGIYVKIAQKYLGISEDGHFGTNTETAVKFYQKKHQLEVDGQIGKQTWSSFFV